MKKGINIHFILIIISAALWGTAGIFVRAIEKIAISEMQIVLARALFTVLILGTVIFIKDKSLFIIKLKDLWLFICSGIFSIVLFNFAYYKTMAATSLSVAAVLLYTAPFFVVIISRFCFKEKITLKKSLALCMAFIGCCMVSGLFDSSHKISSEALVFGLLTGFGYALYTIFGELILRRGYHTLTLTFYVFLTAVIGTLVMVNPYKTAITYFENPKAIGIMFLMGLFNTVLPYVLYTSGLKGVEPSVAPVIATIEPVVATLVGTFLFKEVISIWGVIGIITVLLSVVLLNLQFKNKITLIANAKINIGLDISGKREDGYHYIDTLMQSVSLGDKITVKKSDKISVECDGSDIDNEKNIAYKAAELFFESAKIVGGAEIIIEKYIPLSAGLGGGSADAAAVLLALNEIYDTEITSEKLEEIAAKLGADVPFFIKGGTQRSTGIGEILTPVTPLKKGYFLLIKAGNKPSTGEMYKRLDSENPIHPNMDEVVSAAEAGDLKKLSLVLGNSFIAVNEKFVLSERLKNWGAVGVSLSGSGPTWYGIFENYGVAENAFEALKSEGYECYLAKPLEKAVIFE